MNIATRKKNEAECSNLRQGDIDDKDGSRKNRSDRVLLLELGNVVSYDDDLLDTLLGLYQSRRHCVLMGMHILWIFANEGICAETVP
jgi:hypothetical protein